MNTAHAAPSPDGMPSTLTVLQPPSRSERFLFALGRHQLPVSLAMVAGCILLAVGTGALIAGLSDRRLMLGLFMLVSCLGGIVTLVSVKPPWLEKVATTGHIAAALGSATEEERPHLLARIESRLHAPYQTEPMTISELATFFVATREEHGDRARVRQAQAANARAAQRSALAHLADDHHQKAAVVGD